MRERSSRSALDGKHLAAIDAISPALLPEISTQPDNAPRRTIGFLGMGDPDGRGV
jgi:hypothetical protein